MVRALLILLLASSGCRAQSGEWQLPLRQFTPGALSVDINESTMACTICSSNWTTARVRPPSSFTTALKARQLRTTYASFVERWGANLSAYEEDHLVRAAPRPRNARLADFCAQVPLEIGGHPRSELNLWPQPRKSIHGGNEAEKKDALENRLQELVCTGAVRLREAQQAIAANWSAAYERYMHL